MHPYTFHQDLYFVLYHVVEVRIALDKKNLLYDFFDTGLLVYSKLHLCKRALSELMLDIVVLCHFPI